MTLAVLSDALRAAVVEVDERRAMSREDGADRVDIAGLAGALASKARPQ